MKNQKKIKDDEDYLIQSLMDAPVKNLERRVKEIENEIDERRKLGLEIDAKLSTRQIRLEEELWRNRYNTNTNNWTPQNLGLKFIDLEIQRQRAMVEAFRDISSFKERLINAHEEFEIERHRRKLIE